MGTILLEAFAVASRGILSVGSILLVLLLLSSANGLKKASGLIPERVLNVRARGAAT